MNATTSNTEASIPGQTGEAIDNDQPRQLSRPVHDRMLGGVAAGIARYFGADPTVARIIFAVLAVFGGAGIPLYLAGWLLIPEEGCEESIASTFVHSLQSRSR
jgi:phage shock protein PspC (stress-responsive transcriptional regulator)